MAALISSVMNTKDRVPFYVNACHEMGIEVLPPDVNASQQRLRGRRGEDPLRAERGQERGRGGRARRSSRAREEGGPFDVDLGLHRAGRPAGREQARARVAGQVRRARLDRRDAEGDARRRSSRRSGTGSASTADRLAGQGSIFDGAFGEAEADRRGQHPPISADEFEKSELLRLEKETLGLYVSEHPLRARSATSCGARPTARSPSSSAAATARSSPSAGSSRRSSS